MAEWIKVTIAGRNMGRTSAFLEELRELLAKHRLRIDCVQLYGAGGEKQGIESYFVGEGIEIALSDLGMVHD